MVLYLLLAVLALGLVLLGASMRVAESGRRTAVPRVDPIGIEPGHRPRTPWE
jgi:hypothetical protein